MHTIQNSTGYLVSHEARSTVTKGITATHTNGYLAAVSEPAEPGPHTTAAAGAWHLLHSSADHPSHGHTPPHTGHRRATHPASPRAQHTDKSDPP